MSLESIQGKISRLEMRSIMAGEVKLADNGGGGSGGASITCGRYEGYCWNLQEKVGVPMDYWPCVFTGKQDNYCLKNSWW